MDRKGQISAEFLILMGFVLVIVLVFANVIGDQNEVNNVVTSAKQGASDALAELVFNDRTLTPVRVNTINVVGDENKDIQITLSREISPDNKAIVKERALSSIKDLGFEREGDTIITGRYQYTVTIIP